MAFHFGIKVLCGPMRSGKSNALILNIDKLKYAKVPYLVFKPAIDRFEAEISTRYQGRSEGAIPVKNSDEIYSHIDLEKIPDDLTIAIDEAQFFDMGLVDVVKKLNSLGVNFMIAGLEMDANNSTFGPMGDLLALATEVIKMRAICELCGEESTKTGPREYTMDLEKNNVVPEESNFLTLCAKCFYKRSKEMKK